MRDPAAAHAGLEPLPPAARSLHDASTQPLALKEQNNTDFYDPALKSQSAVFLEERGARIRDVRILTLAGRHVNVLQMGKRYVFEYRVEFSRPASSIGFGIWFRTTSGLGLAGAQTERSRTLTLKSAEPGHTVLVRYRFDARLTPGTYFLCCGVTGDTSEGRHVLHRAYDIQPIRIAPEKDLIATGFLDLSPDAEISLETQVPHPHASEEKIPCAR
jgi:lipopolysaccharide transport system ATP-binding protein